MVTLQNETQSALAGIGSSGANACWHRHSQTSHLGVCNHRVNAISAEDRIATQQNTPLAGRKVGLKPEQAEGTRRADGEGRINGGQLEIQTGLPRMTPLSP